MKRAWVRWTDDEEAQLEKLYKAGTPIREIVTALGRDKVRVQNKLARLGVKRPKKKAAR